MSRTAPRAIAAVAFSIIALAGCSFSAGGTNSVPQADVEEQVSTKLEEQVGQAPDKVECPEDLEAEVGTEMVCVLTAGGDTIDVTVTVTEVEGTNVNFDVEVADEVN